MNLVEKSSRERKVEREISKRGRNILRYVGYLVTNIAISKNKEIKELFHYRLSETGGKEKMKILVGLNAKMLRIMFTVCKKRGDKEILEMKWELRSGASSDKTPIRRQIIW